jgi:hypothetical protein
MRPPIYVAPQAVAEPEVVEEILDAADAGDGAFRTRRHYWRGTVWLLVALGFQFLASLVPDLVERFYSNLVYRYLVRVLAIPSQFLTGLALGEVFFLLLIAYFILWTIWYILRSWQRRTRLINVIKLFFLHLLWVGSILFPIFLFVWGLNYQRLPLAETMNLDRRPAARTGELEGIAVRLTSEINTNYERARGGANWAGASILPMTPAVLNRSLEAAFQAEPLLGAAGQGGFAEPKALRLSRITTLMGVSGFYISYTAEVTYNSEVPPVDLPMTIAHHKAHQRGWAREDEANFIAFLACTRANEPYIRYSGYVHALRVLEPIGKAEPARLADMLGRLAAGPRDDLRIRTEFWGNAKNAYLGAFSRRMFDIYLRACRVHTGAKNYDEDIYLMTSYFLKNLNPTAPTELTPLPGSASPTPASAPTPTPTPTPDFSEPER